jgi:OOP family OmpA-OmpF porin
MADAGRRPLDDPEFAELRALLVGPEQRQLSALEAQVGSGARAREVSRVLPEAIALRSNDPQLTRALAPTIEESITASVRRNPRPLADALFPVIGPAIRKAIAHTLSSMMESLNRTIEQSVSWRALQWRWTALRTGTPYAQIVLLNTLQYRVEQIFLIHRETGLLLQHVSADPRGGQDADQISAMLTAIRDFVSDSFHTRDGDTLDALRVGDLAVLVEQGPDAILAGVVRGTPPYTLRASFQEALETIHLLFGVDLSAFRGDAAPFERARPLLESCLVTQFRDRPRTAANRRWLVAAAALLLVVGLWAAIRVRDSMRWNSYIDRVGTEPGIVVLSEGRRGGQFFVTGLRDPLARDPAELIGGSALPATRIESRWVPHESLHPPFVIARARNLLKPPPGVALAYAGGVLTASGPATERWIAESERLAPALKGVDRLSYAGPSPIVQTAEQLDRLTIRFQRGRSDITQDQQATVERMADLLRILDESLRTRDRRARVEVSGHTDADGSDSINGTLSRARADAVLQRLNPQRFSAIEFSAVGMGSTAPFTVGTAGQEKEQNRRVSLHTHLLDAPGGAGER